MSEIICPVPKNQRPLNEFNNIKDSWIISWPILGNRIFYKKLIFSWFLFLPINITISLGSPYLRNNLFDFIFISLISSIILPMLLLIRQWLSWKYILKRLNSESIEYEESGWYDGQTWEKPLDWRAKDQLIAQHEVKPILMQIENALKLILICILYALSFRLIKNSL